MLTADEISALVGEAAPLLEGARVQDVHQRDENTVILTFYAGGHGKLFLLLSTRPGFARFHLVPERPRALPEPPPFTEAARKHIVGSRVTGLRQVSGDRIIELDLAPPAARGGEGHALIHEMLGKRPRLVLAGPRRRVLAVLEAAGRGRALAPGDEYRFPAAKPKPRLLQALTSNPWRYFGGEAGEPEHGFPAPLHLALGREAERLEAEDVGRSWREAIRSALAKARDRRARLEEKVAADLAAAEARLEDREKGELLKGALGRIRRGMSSVEVEDWFRPGFPRVEVRLDPALGPVENVERYFKRFRKAERAVPIIRERLDRVRAERARIDELLALADDAGASPAEIEERAAGLLERTRGATREAGAARPRPRGEKARRGEKAGPGLDRGGSGLDRGGPRRSALEPRRFRSGDGFEILVGKSAEANDHLTFRIARGDDLFLHVAGRPGAHVIVRAIKGKSFPLETIIDAGILALYYGLPERSRGAAGKPAAGGVDYAPVKDVKKAKGARPGLVLLRKHKTVRVRLDAARLERLRASGGAGVETRDS